MHNSLQNQQSLTKLVRAINLSLGRFSLIVVRCNYSAVKQQILSELRQGSGLQIREIRLDKSATNLYTILQGEIGSSPPDVAIVSGFESVGFLDDLLTSMNQVRDDFPKTFPFPLVLWMNDFVLQKFVRLAPDYYSYAGAPIQFAIATDELIKFLQQETERVFNQILASDTDVFIPPTDIGKPGEIESALRELENRGCHQPELEALEKFILGQDAYINNDMTRSHQLWSESLSFWQPPVGAGFPRPLGRSEGEKEGRREERRACVLFHLGLWWRRYAVQHRGEYKFACTKARDYYQQCVEVLQQINRLDLVAKFISSLGETLLQLRQWDKLEQVAKQAIELHQTYPNNTRLAYAYGFLAEVALGREDWVKAKEYGETALEINEKLTGSKPEATGTKPAYAGSEHQIFLSNTLYKSWYLFLISQAHQHLNQILPALQKLKMAQEEAIPDYHPQLYIRILDALQNLYFKSSKYLQAFHIKQEKFAVEQQYGLRAFIGAGRLRSQRQVIHPALVPFASVGLDSLEQGREFPTGDIAQEIKASGRQQDVNRLVERLSRPDNKLIVIYGPSGVGKSSLITAGLVPALQQITMMEGRQPLPVVVRVYTDWLGEVRNELVSSTGDDLPRAILQQLRHNAEGNLLTILIFDQFEEFFFNCPQPADRRDFWEFLHQCLDSIDIPYVKVILSLREDYLHYLLECDRLTNLQATNNDILNQDIRYYFGDFSPEEAKTVINSLTEKSAVLEPALIDELVRDLAGDVEEVRPIELQVVGTQLETEKITTLAGYQEYGPKEKLVDRFLAAVVEDCGEENERVAQLVLYLLTDENNTRPLKTKAELAEALDREVDKLDLVLEILVTSGIVFLIPQFPADCYQLVHDYLVAFIRQQRGAELLAELKWERQQRQEAEAKLNGVLKRRLREAYIAGAGLLAVTAVAVVFWVESYRNSINAEINLMRSVSEHYFAANLDRECLVQSLKTGQQLKRTPKFWVNPDTKTQAVATLHQAIYGVKDIELKTLKAHSNRVWSVSISPDGKTIASASDDKTIKLWTVDGKLIKTLKGHSNRVYSVSFSPDGKTIASASEDKTIKLWTVDGKLIKTLPENSGKVNSVSFSPDGKTIASASDDKTIKLWTVDGKLIKTLPGHSSWVNSVSFSPDGKTIASAGADTTIKLWTVDGKLIITLPGHSSWVNSVNFSPDGKTIASASADTTIKLWTFDGKLIKTLPGHGSTVYSISFSPDGKTIASASADTTIKLWTVDGKLIKTLKGHSSWVYSVSFSPDGKTIASASEDKTIKLWTVDGKTIKTLPGHSSTVISVSFSPDGKTIASASEDKTIKLWTVDGKTIKTLKGHSNRVYSVSFSPDGKTIASASEDKTIKLWTIDGKPIKTLLGHSRWVNSVSFSPDGKTIASASADKTIKLWTVDGKTIKTLPGHSSTVISVSFSPDGKTIASASEDKTIKLWTIDGKPIKTLKSHSSTVWSVSFSPDGKTIASASDDKTIKLWTVDGKLIKTLAGHGSKVYNVSFSPDGKTIASASDDKTIKLWTVDGKLIKTLPGHGSTVYSISFSPDGKTIASASDDKTIKLWSFNLEELLVEGCDLLQQDYLIYHPQTLEELRVCQNQKMFVAAASTLVAEGEDLAQKGDYEEALAKFQKAKAWNSKLDFNPEVKAAPALVKKGIELAQEGDIEGAVAKFKQVQQLDTNIDLNPNTEELEKNSQTVATKLAAPALVNKGKELVQQGKVKEAVAAYTKAQKNDPTLEIPANDWNALCWYGSLYDGAKDVMFACEKAVALTPEDGGIRDSRGVARALTGDTKGAIEDFEAFVKWIDNDKHKSQRQYWIKSLRAGKNPFTPDVLRKLRNQ